MSDSKAKKTRKTKAVKSLDTATEKTNEENIKPLELIDVTCPVCLSIMIEPVTMPCTHALCMVCFELNVSESNLACPLCRKRISIWVRKMTKIKGLIDQQLWKRIQEDFKDQIAARQKGEEDLNNTFTSTFPPRKVSAPGEIKEEYETEMRKIQEEQEKRKRDEEKISTSILIKLQEEEKRRLEEQTRLSSDDFDFAKQLRSSQISQALQYLKKGKKKKKSSQDALPRKSIPVSPVTAPIDSYLCQTTPSTSTHWFAPTLGHSTPREQPTNKRWNKTSAFEKLLKKNPGPGAQGGSITESPSLFASTPSSSDRLLKDITSHYSSESESEFDSEENIRRSKKVRSDRSPRAATTNKENNQDRVKEEAATTSKPQCKLNEVEEQNNIPCEPREEFVGGDTQEQLLRAFEGEELDEDLLSKLMEEQKAVEERLKQEKEDRLFALQLQKDMKKIDRTKGSKDEYSLRTNSNPMKRPAQYSPELPIGNGGVPSTASPTSSCTASPTSSCTSSSKKNKFRQTTLFETLSKKQRRL